MNSYVGDMTISPKEMIHPFMCPLSLLSGRRNTFLKAISDRKPADGSRYQTFYNSGQVRYGICRAFQGMI